MQLLAAGNEVGRIPEQRKEEREGDGGDDGDEEAARSSRGTFGINEGKPLAIRPHASFLGGRVGDEGFNIG